MTDNINKNIENDELDLEQLEDVGGGLNDDSLMYAASKKITSKKLGLSPNTAKALASGLGAVTGLSAKISSARDDDDQ